MATVKCELSRVPALVLVFQPLYGNYRYFMTGGCKDASQWMLGSLNGEYTADELPAGAQRVARGVYSVPSTGV